MSRSYNQILNFTYVLMFVNATAQGIITDTSFCGFPLSFCLLIPMHALLALLATPDAAPD